MTRVRVLLAIAAVAMGVGLWFALTAPTDTLQGEFTRIINIHAPSMWLAFLAFGMTALGSAIWLIRKQSRWDRLAEASAELGVMFTAIGLFSGMVWGQAVWGRAWDWGDPRLSTTAVMFFVYIGYLALRAATPDPTVRARRSAILGVIAVVQVPLVYFSVNMFRTLHQTQSIRPDGITMPREMAIAIFVNVIAFTIVYIALLFARIDVAKAEERAAADIALAGDAVKPPRLSEVKDV
ncbi:MAG TPA: cytochrome c biogenesis protein CcsA [Acidimicrobiia bacterium]